MTTTGYSVHLEARAPRNEPPIADPEAVMDDLADRLPAHHGICSVGTRSWAVTVTVDASDAQAAASRAVAIIDKLAGDVNLHRWPLVRIETVREDVQAEDLERPDMPDLVTAVEAADMLGVTRQRLHQLADRHPDFPQPAYTHDRVSLYHRAAVERFSEEWQRKPGRPRRVSPHVAA